jgi:hypothetical protein
MYTIPKDAMWRDVYGWAMEMDSQEEADEYFLALVEYNMKAGVDREEAEKVARDNLGYWAGYYDDETRQRVERLFRCSHPIFGSIEKNGPPTPEAAFLAGMRMGEKAKKES